MFLVHRWGFGGTCHKGKVLCRNSLAVRLWRKCMVSAMEQEEQSFWSKVNLCQSVSSSRNNGESTRSLQ